MKGKILIIGCGVVSLLVAQACCPCKELASTTVKDTKDSVNIKTETNWTDTSLYTPVDLVSVLHLIPAPIDGVINLKEVTKKSNNASVHLSIKDNKILASCKCDSIELKARLYKKQISIYKQHVENLNAVRVIEIEKIPKWAQYLMWIGAAAILGWIIKLVIKIYKIFI